MFLFGRREGRWIYDHLQHYTFAELYTMKHELEKRLQLLKKQEPRSGRKNQQAYNTWIGQNVECIDHLQRVQKEIHRRKRNALAFGISPMKYDVRGVLL